MRVNKKIRIPKVRLVGANGEQIGIVSTAEALEMAQKEGLDLVEVAPHAHPPVCKIINYGKFKYEQSKRDKQQKKTQFQIKIKEVKVKPNISAHDLNFKTNHARQFIEKGHKVKVTCTFRGREQAHPEIGQKIVLKICEDLKDIASPEAPVKRMGRMLTTVLAPLKKKQKLLKQTTV